MKYVIQKTDKSHCKYCNFNVHLLIEDSHLMPLECPSFYICFQCKRVFQIGVGEVERAEE